MSVSLTKRCAKCGIYKSLSEFRKHSGKSLGVDSRCKPCKGYRGLREFHGLTGSKLYRIWSNMMGRCFTKTNAAYKDYGGRGITVCSRWESLGAFAKDMGNPPKGFTLDRIDNDGPYSPENCKWSNHKEQARNRRSTYKVTIEGETKSLMQWVEEIGVVGAPTVRERITVHGWDPFKALTTPPIPHSQRKRNGRI